ncbi:MAG: phage protein Gp27 family protein [Clostridia bacterium]
MAERERTRIHCLVDDLPDDVRHELDDMLSDTSYGYIAISEWLKVKGYTISKSSIGRYAKRNGKMQLRLREINESAREYANLVRENQELDIAKVATSVYLQQLMTRITEAGSDEFAAIGIADAGKLLGQIMRASVYEGRYSAARKDDISEAAELVMQQFRAQVTQDPALLESIQRMVYESKDRAKQLEDVKDAAN